MDEKVYRIQPDGQVKKVFAGEITTLPSTVENGSIIKNNLLPPQLLNMPNDHESIGHSSKSIKENSKPSKQHALLFQHKENNSNGFHHRLMHSKVCKNVAIGASASFMLLVLILLCMRMFKKKTRDADSEYAKLINQPQPATSSDDNNNIVVNNNGVELAEIV